jgi:hypothetical protein
VLLFPGFPLVVGQRIEERVGVDEVLHHIGFPLRGLTATSLATGVPATEMAISSPEHARSMSTSQSACAAATSMIRITFYDQ